MAEFKWKKGRYAKNQNYNRNSAVCVEFASLRLNNSEGVQYQTNIALMTPLKNLLDQQ